MGGGSGPTALSPLENVGLGVAAGTIEVTILQPMLYCKNASQQGLPITVNPAVLYRGLTMSVVNMSILTGLQFPLTGIVSKAITRGEDRKLDSAEQISAGFIGGALSGFVCAPMELVMIQQQRNGGGLFFQASRVINECGITSLFRGLATSCGREGLFTAGYLGVAPVLAAKLKESFGVEGRLGSFLGACCAGIVAATLSHPLDTVKTCLQGDVAQETYRTMTSTFSTLMKEGGIGRFFNGWSWRFTTRRSRACTRRQRLAVAHCPPPAARRTGRMICAIWIMGQCKDRLAPILYPRHFAKPEGETIS